MPDGPSNSVGVLGAGCICAAGAGLTACTRAILDGERYWREDLRFPTGHTAQAPLFPCRAVPVENDPRVFRTAHLVERATDLALADAGVPPGALAGLRVGVCVGTITSALLSNETYYSDRHRQTLDSATLRHRHGRDGPAARLARLHGLTGPVVTLSNACTSGADAIALAAGWIRTGRCDLALAGGGDELGHALYAGFRSLGLLAESPCRPFDRDRDGLNLGEGAALVLLASASAAAHLGRPPRATLVGAGMGTDAYHLAAPHPEGRGLRAALRAALAAAGPTPLAFVNAHGTGTRDNDRVEGRVLAQELPAVPFFSLKGHTGHTMGGAGAIEFCLSLGLLERGEMPASAGFERADPEVGGVPVTVRSAISERAALSLSLGFGGQNTALLLRLGP